MTEPVDPPRLKDSPGSSGALEEALRALGRQDAGSRRLERVAQRLGPLLDGPPPPGWWLARLARSKPILARVLVGALSMSAVAVWLRSPPRPAATAPAQPHDVRAQPVEGPRATQLEAVPRQGLEAGTSAAPSVAAPEAPSSPARAEPPRPRARRAARPRTHPAPHGADQHARPGAAADSMPISNAVQDEVPAADTLSRPPPSASSLLEAPLPEPPHSRLPNEVELLLAARQQRERAPAETLRMLDVHARRFPRGLLAPEREVLAIEALRALGHDDAARARLAAFRARYPDSMHLRRLEAEAR